MAKRLTKKQKVENYIIKHPDMRPVDIAKKVDAAPAYIGQIRRDLAAARPELKLPQVKRGRHSSPAKKGKARQAAEGQVDWVDGLVEEVWREASPEIEHEIEAEIERLIQGGAPTSPRTSSSACSLLLGSGDG